MRTYWLDRDLATPAMETLLAMFEVEQAPTLIIDGEKIEEFISLAALEERLPAWLIEEKIAEREAAALPDSDSDTSSDDTDGTQDEMSERED